MSSEKCCFCFDLKMGVRTLGIVLVILSAFSVVAGVIAVNETIRQSLGEEFLPYGKVVIIGSLLSILINSFLLIDRWGERVKCGLIVWLMLTPPAVVVITVAGIYLFMVHSVHALHLNDLGCKIVGGVCFTMAGLLCYFWAVVYNLHKRLDREVTSDSDAIGIFVVQGANEPTYGKGPPPNYSSIVLNPPPPDYVSEIEPKTKY